MQRFIKGWQTQQLVQDKLLAIGYWVRANQQLAQQLGALYWVSIGLPDPIFYWVIGGKKTIIGVAIGVPNNWLCANIASSLLWCNASWVKLSK